MHSLRAISNRETGWHFHCQPVRLFIDQKSVLGSVHMLCEPGKHIRLVNTVRKICATA